ncbi:MAG: hypothetical protein HOB62_04200 [Gammaproteobacteria bacterium]|jgi:hypothetical protein|nr:hypothetical protein [Gammaproteobacteria bacterium]MBT4658117.1 hypothetical protein [Gammaproteobacteria bacterium]
MNLDSKVQIIDEDELKKVLPDIFKRAQTSDEFRQLCLESPEKAVFEVTGKRLPDGANLSFSNDDQASGT